MKIKLILFDFDGTIVSNLDRILKIFQGIAEKYGCKKLSDSEVENLRNRTTQDAFKYLGISIFKLPFVVQKIREELNHYIGETKTVGNIRETLMTLRKRGYRLGILTSNSRENVSVLLKKNDLEVFDLVYTGHSMFGKAKVLKQLLHEMKLDPQEVIYVGDETRDIEAAGKAKIKMVAVSWGFNKRGILQSLDPEYLIDTPEELLSLFKAGP